MADGSRIRLVALLSAAVFSSMTVAVMTGPLLVALASAFDTSVASAGQLAAAIGISWGITAPLVGPVSDIYGRRRVALIGVLLMAAGTLGSILVWDYWGLLACRLVTGVGAAMIPPNSMATIADHFAPAERGAPISILISASNSAFVIALPVIAAVAAIGGWQLPFIVVEVYLAGVWVWHWYGFPVRSAGARQTLGFAAHFKAVAQIRTLWCVLLANILFRAASFAVFTYFVAFLVQSYGLTQSETAVPLGCVGLGAMLGSFVGGWVARSGRRLYWAAAGLAAGGLCLGLALDGGTAPWSAVLLGCGGVVLLTVFEPVSWVLTAELSGESRATANGLLATSNQLGVIGGGSVAGLVLAVGGFASIGVFCVASGALAAIIVLGIALTLQAGRMVEV